MSKQVQIAGATAAGYSSVFDAVPSLDWGAGSEGAVIKGENLAVLLRLRQIHEARVRCIYLDPPYNNGDRYTHYTDSLSSHQWLEEVVERVAACRALLSDDGSLWVSIDDSEMHYLKVALDNVFGRENFITTIVWQQRTTRENRKVFSNDHEYLLVYARNAARFRETRNRLPATTAILARYKNPDDDPRGPWQSVSANVQAGHATASQFYEFVAPNGARHQPPKGRCWNYTEERMQALVQDGRVYFGRKGGGVPRLKRFLAEAQQGVTPETLWRAENAGTNREAKKQLLALLDDEPVFDTPKPESLIRRILHIATNPGDLVLDPYLGSGTTAAVAHKMGRRWIGVEVGDHVQSHARARLVKVVEGEQSGVSSVCRWSGGGGFSFFKCTA